MADGSGAESRGGGGGSGHRRSAWHFPLSCPCLCVCVGLNRRCCFFWHSPRLAHLAYLYSGTAASGVSCEKADMQQTMGKKRRAWFSWGGRRAGWLGRAVHPVPRLSHGS